MLVEWATVWEMGIQKRKQGIKQNKYSHVGSLETGSLFRVRNRSVCFYEHMPENIIMTHGRDHGRGDTIKHTERG